jgi:hypothetical protein
VDEGRRDHTGRVRRSDDHGRYALCFYDGTGALLQQANVPPGTDWALLGTKGYKYKNQTGAQDGITKIILKVAMPGRARRW